MNLSKDENTLGTFFNDIRLAKSIANKNENIELLKQMDSELIQMFYQYVSMIKSTETCLANFEECYKFANFLLYIMIFAQNLGCIIVNDYDKEKVYKSAIEIYDSQIYKKLRFKDERNNNRETPFVPADDYCTNIKNVRSMLADGYNNLPHRAQKYNDSKNEYQKLLQETEQLRSDLLHLSKSPNMYNAKLHKEVNVIPTIVLGIVTGIIVYVVTMLSLLAVSIESSSDNMFFSFAMWTVICAVVDWLVIKSIIKNKKKMFYSALVPVEEKCFSDQLYNAKIKYYRSVVEVERAKRKYELARREQK